MDASVDHKKHRAAHGGKKEKTKKQKVITDKQKTQNPKAFAPFSGRNADLRVRRRLDLDQHKLHKEVEDRSVPVEPPLFVAVVGPSKVGKSTVIRSLIKKYTRKNVKDVTGPVTIVTGKARRITLYECPNDLATMIDVSKTADLVLLVIDAHFGFEMETFEFLNLCQVHGFPRVMGVLTHLDSFNKQSQVRTVKKDMKKRFWTEVYKGAKLFYFTGLLPASQLYPKREVLNLARFISIVKLRPLSYRSSHAYLIVDRLEDLTPPLLLDKIAKSSKKRNDDDDDDDDGNSEMDVDSDSEDSGEENKRVNGETIHLPTRRVALYGYLRGNSIPPLSSTNFHVPGIGDINPRRIDRLNDPCPMPSQSDEPGSKDSTRRRTLDDRARLVYAPMADIGDVIYDNDAVYLPEASNSHQKGKSLDESIEVGPQTFDDQLAETMITLVEGGQVLQEVDEEDDEDDEEDDGDQDEEEEDEDGFVDREKVDYAAIEESESDGEYETTSRSPLQKKVLMSGEELRRLIYSCRATLTNEEEMVPQPADDLSVGFGSMFSSKTLARRERKSKERAARAEGTFVKRNMNSDANEKDDNENDSENDDDDDDDDDDDGDFFRPKSSSSKSDFARTTSTNGNRSFEKSLVALDSPRSHLVLRTVSEIDAKLSAPFWRWDNDEIINSVKELFVTGGWGIDGMGGEAASDTEHSDDGDEDKAPPEGKDDAKEADEQSDDDEPNPIRDIARIRADQAKSAKERAEERSKTLETLSRTGHTLKGSYVRMEFPALPSEFIEHFDPRYMVLVGQLSAGETRSRSASSTSSTSSGVLLQVRFKRHRWFPKILKANDPLILSMGWRRTQTCPIYSLPQPQDAAKLRYLKYTPQHMHCNMVAYAPRCEPGVGCVAVQSLGNEGNWFRVSGTGVCLSVHAVAGGGADTAPGEKVLSNLAVNKKLKMIGYPQRIAKKTCFVRGMFNSALEVAKFQGAKILTVSGVRGLIKKPEGEHGIFRATFEDKILMSDIVIMKCWTPVSPIPFCLDVQHHLARGRGGDSRTVWKGLKTVREIRQEKGSGMEIQRDSLYENPINRPNVRKFDPLKIPKKIEKDLPFASRPKLQKARKDKNKPRVDKKNPYSKVKAGLYALKHDINPLRGDEKRAAALLQQLNTIKREKTQKVKVKKTEERSRYEAKKAEIEGKKKAKQRLEMKKRKANEAQIERKRVKRR